MAEPLQMLFQHLRVSAKEKVTDCSVETSSRAYSVVPIANM